MSLDETGNVDNGTSSMAIYKEPVFNDMVKYAVVTTVLGAGMLAPALAVVLTRLFTKEGFGTDYPLFPWLGIGIMCVMCIFMNAFMTLVTERTKSIYPTCFIHGIYNYLGINFMMPAFMTEKAAEKMNELAIWEAYPFILSGMIIVGTVSMVMFCKKEK